MRRSRNNKETRRTTLESCTACSFWNICGLILRVLAITHFSFVVTLAVLSSVIVGVRSRVQNFPA